MTETFLKVLGAGGKAADTNIASAMVHAAVEPFTAHAALVTITTFVVEPTRFAAPA